MQAKGGKFTCQLGYLSVGCLSAGHPDGSGAAAEKLLAGAGGRGKCLGSGSSWAHFLNIIRIKYLLYICLSSKIVLICRKTA